jgi:hypothetical protein
VIKLDLKLKESKKVKEEDKSALKNVFRDLGKGEFKKKKGEEEGEGGGKKRKMTALEEIMEMEKRRKRAEKEKEEKEEEEASAGTSLPWLRKNIVVKIVTKSLGDKYFKKKGYVKVGRIRFCSFPPNKRVIASIVIFIYSISFSLCSRFRWQGVPVWFSERFTKYEIFFIFVLRKEIRIIFVSRNEIVLLFVT